MDTPKRPRRTYSRRRGSARGTAGGSEIGARNVATRGTYRKRDQRCGHGGGFQTETQTDNELPPHGGGQVDGDAGQDLQRGHAAPCGGRCATPCGGRAAARSPHGGAPARSAGPRGIINKNKRGTSSKNKRQKERERAPKPKKVSLGTTTSTGVHTRTRSAAKAGGRNTHRRTAIGYMTIRGKRGVPACRL